MPWDVSRDETALRRLTLPELATAVETAGFQRAECVFRFRDRVVLRAAR